MYTSTILSTALLVASSTAQYGGYGSGGYGGGSYMSSGSPWMMSSSTSMMSAATSVAAAPPTAPSPAAAVAGASGELVVQIVSVSDNNGSLAYFPNNIQAAAGTIVQFQYHPKNHTITESSFTSPCVPVAANLSTPTRPGTKSGFVPVTPTDAETPVFNMLINDTKPMWLYCGQTNHCQKGMSMVINENATSGKTLQAYQAAAAQLPLVSTSVVASVASTSTDTVAATGLATAPPPPPPSAETTTSVGLAAPTEAASATAPAAPATFTGAAVRAEVVGGGSVFVAGLVGLFALL